MEEEAVLIRRMKIDPSQLGPNVPRLQPHAKKTPQLNFVVSRFASPFVHGTRETLGSFGPRREAAGLMSMGTFQEARWQQGEIEATGPGHRAGHSRFLLFKYPTTASSLVRLPCADAHTQARINV